MRRFLLGGLLLSSIKRSPLATRCSQSPSFLHNTRSLTTTTNTCKNYHNSLDHHNNLDFAMEEQPFEKMKEEGVPQCPAPAPQPEQKEEVKEQAKALPKLNAKEYRTYNRMAEIMNAYVRYHLSSPSIKENQETD